MSVFSQNHGVTPLQIFDFLDFFFKLDYSGLKSILLYPTVKRRSFVARFPQLTHMRERWIFWQKLWTNPFASFLFFGLFLTLLFWSRKLSCLFRIWKNDLLWLHITKIHTWEKGRFLTKTIDYRLCKFALFCTFCKLYYSRLRCRLGFPRKTHMRKRSIFWQKPWSNLFANNRVCGLFSDFTIPV